MTQVLRLAALLSVASLAACDKGITAPDCDRCDEMRVLTDRLAYRPGSTIVFSISNRTTDVLRYDWCSVGLQSRGNTNDFPTATYLPSRRCGIGAGLTEVLSHMVVIPAGGMVRDSSAISGAANQSWYRVTVWLVDETGVPQQANPVVSNTIDIYPGAKTSISPR
jgi:hypothetical protein